MSEQITQAGVSWSEILTREYASKIATLVMAVWLHAANSMLTATTMPSAVEEIGGLNLISWTFALYLMGSIIAGASSSLLVKRYGIRGTMIRAAAVYGIGCVVCAMAPSMPIVLIKLYHLSPFEAGLIVMLETLGWGIAAIIFSGIQANNEPRLIRSGCALVVCGLVAMALVLPHGPMWLVIVVVILSNGGFGMMWGFVIKRIIGSAPSDEKDRAASVVPITQQTGFALGAALCGLIANSLGMSDDISNESLRDITYWLFAGFVPFALMANLIAWRFVRAVGKD